jgi:hypothetical protein
MPSVGMTQLVKQENTTALLLFSLINCTEAKGFADLPAGKDHHANQLLMDL